MKGIFQSNADRQQQTGLRCKENMKKRRGIAAVMAAVLLVCAFPLTAYADKISDLEKEINERKEEKEQTESEIKSRKNELAGLNEEAEGLKGQLNSLNSELTAVSNNLAELEEKIADKNAEIETTEKELEDAWEKEGIQYEAMKKRIQFMYEKRDYIMMEMLFGSANFAELLNRQDYIEKLSEYDRKQLDEFIAIREEIEEKEAQLVQEKEDLDELKVSVEAEQSRFQGLVGQVSGEINSTQQEMAQTEAEMLQYEKELAEQKSDIARLQEELAEERRLSQLAAQSAWRNISDISFAEGDRYLLANLIYCEAGNQPYEGQVAVGAVVMNRVMSSVFPDTVVGVIYQNKQFSPVASGRLALALAENRATDACYRAADAAMTGTTTVGNCLFFRTPIEGLTGTRIGGHIFY
ncbi:cell wall hydrolase [Parablautia intestinalis]|uniref:cell wall hydrolase n=1 Tax=Parablautia intestinalis TaxID=2320100 RepID=UPI00256ED95A|nr:cell wall hydrolase [Parablautia intestinalis]